MCVTASDCLIAFMKKNRESLLPHFKLSQVLQSPFLSAVQGDPPFLCCLHPQHCSLRQIIIPLPSYAPPISALLLSPDSGYGTKAPLNKNTHAQPRTAPQAARRVLGSCAFRISPNGMIRRCPGGCACVLKAFSHLLQVGEPPTIRQRVPLPHKRGEYYVKRFHLSIPKSNFSTFKLEIDEWRL